LTLGNELDRGQHNPIAVFSVIFPSKIGPTLGDGKYIKATDDKEWKLCWIKNYSNLGICFT
jgi:hypothetical protein